MVINLGLYNFTIIINYKLYMKLPHLITVGFFYIFLMQKLLAYLIFKFQSNVGSFIILSGYLLITFIIMMG